MGREQRSILRPPIASYLEGQCNANCSSWGFKWLRGGGGGASGAAPTDTEKTGEKVSVGVAPGAANIDPPTSRDSVAPGAAVPEEAMDKKETKIGQRMRRAYGPFIEKIEVPMSSFDPTETEHLLTHVPKMAGCPACSIGKTKHKPCKRKMVKASEKYTKFGELVTIDHIEASGIHGSFDGHSGILSILDVATGFRFGCPVKSKNENDTTIALSDFKGKSRIALIYCDRAPELQAAARNLGISCNHSVAGRSQTNGLIERGN